MKSNEFIKNFSILMEVYGVSYSEATIEIYYRILKDLDGKEFEKAVHTILSERPFPTFPKPAELLSAIATKNEEKAVLAADNLRKAVSMHGSYKTVIFDDPVIHIVLERHFGGWIKFCEMTIEDMEKFFKFEFEKLYKAYASQKNIEIKTKLIGKHDAQNEDKSPDEVGRYDRYIGDKEKAVKWITAYENKMLSLNGVDKKILELAAEKTIKIGDKE